MSDERNIQCACGATCACSPCVCPPVREEAGPTMACGCGTACDCGPQCRCGQ
jgi:hypothetical protein